MRGKEIVKEGCEVEFVSASENERDVIHALNGNILGVIVIKHCATVTPKSQSQKLPPAMSER